MILPGKHLKQDRALLGVGGEILTVLENDLTVSELWERVRSRKRNHVVQLSFDWFVLALSFLYAIDAIDYDGSVIMAKGNNAS